MSIARNIQLIYDGLFNSQYPPDQFDERLPNVSTRFVNWPRCRRALMVLADMTWYDFDQDWRYFLEEEKFPRTRPMDLRPEEVDQYMNLLHQVRQDTKEGFRILRAVHPEVPPTEHVVVVEAQDFKSLLHAVQHIEDVCNLASADGAVKISAYHSGSLEIVIAAIGLSLHALSLAISMAEKLRRSPIDKDVRRDKRLLESYGIDNVSEEKLHEDAVTRVRDEFWDEWKGRLDDLIAKEGKKSVAGEVYNRIDKAAILIYENADKATVTWKQPTAVIRGLPNGVEVEYYDDPDLILDKLLELPSPRANEEDH